MVVGSCANQRRNLLAVTMTELWDISNQLGGSLLANPLDFLKELVLFFEVRVLVDEIINLAVELLQPVLEPSDVLWQALYPYGCFQPHAWP